MELAMDYRAPRIHGLDPRSEQRLIWGQLCSGLGLSQVALAQETPERNARDQETKKLPKGKHVTAGRLRRKTLTSPGEMPA